MGFLYFVAHILIITFTTLSLRLTLLLIATLTFFKVSYSQNEADSLKLLWEDTSKADSKRFKAINTYYKRQTYAQPDTVLTLTHYHYKLAEDKDSKEEMMNALNERSYAYYLKGDTKKSMSALNQTVAICKTLDMPNFLATLYGNMGSIYGEEQKYQEAVQYFNKTLQIFKEQYIPKGEARMLNNLGLIYYKLDSYDLALSYFNESIVIYESMGLTNKTGTTIADIGAVYYKQGKYNEAVDKGYKALKILQDINDKFSTADCYYMLAQSYLALNEKEKAQHYVDKSLEIDKAIKNNSRIIERLTFKANLIYDTDINLATEKAEAVLKLVEDDTENELKVELYNLLYKCYKAQNKYSLSLGMHEKREVYNDSLKIEKDNMVIIKDAVQKEYENKLFNTQLENERTQLELKEKQLQKTLTIVSIAAFLILSMLLYFRHVLKKNREKRALLLEELEVLKSNSSANLVVDSNEFQLIRDKIEESINRKLNETDWKVLNILLDQPEITNKEIAEKAFMSVDGIGSSLRRMYDYFNVKHSKYKKISLLTDAIKRSNS